MIKHSFNVRIANEYDVHAIMQITKQASVWQVFRTSRR